MLRIIFALALIAAVILCEPDCNSRKLFCMDNGPCPSGYARTSTVNSEDGCPFCDACVSTSLSSKPKNCGEPLCVDITCPSGSTKEPNVVLSDGCLSCPVCVKHGSKPQVPKDCKAPICAQLHCQLKVQTKDERGCPGCPKCLELELGMADEKDVDAALNAYIDEVLSEPKCPKLDCPKLECRLQVIGWDENDCITVSIIYYANI